MKSKIFFTCLMFLALFLSNRSSAALIPYTAITPTSSLVHSSSWTLDKIADGVYTDYIYPDGGFVSTSTTGTVRLTFNTDFNLESFVLWNDVNVGDQGVRTFRLDFFNAAGTSLGSTSVLNATSVLAAQTYSFSNTIYNVRKVDFVILSASYQIEVREVSFNSVVTNPVPEPSSLILFCLAGVVATVWQKR